MAHACHPSTKEIEVGGLEVQCHSVLHGKCEAILGYMRL